MAITNSGSVASLGLRLGGVFRARLALERRIGRVARTGAFGGANVGGSGVGSPCGRQPPSPKQSPNKVSRQGSSPVTS